MNMLLNFFLALSHHSYHLNLQPMLQRSGKWWISFSAILLCFSHAFLWVLMLNKCASIYCFQIFNSYSDVMPPTASFAVNMLGISLPKHFERPYYIVYNYIIYNLYNNKGSRSLIIMRLLYIVSSFKYSSYLDHLYIHAFVFKETSWCFCTGAIWHIRKPVYEQAFKILSANTLCLHFANSTLL